MLMPIDQAHQWHRATLSQGQRRRWEKHDLLAAGLRAADVKECHQHLPAASVRRQPFFAQARYTAVRLCAAAAIDATMRAISPNMTHLHFATIMAAKAPAELCHGRRRHQAWHQHSSPRHAAAAGGGTVQQKRHDTNAAMLITNER